MSLKAKELHEPVQVTIGRLRTAIKYKGKERQLDLLEKLANDISELQLELRRAGVAAEEQEDNA